MDVPHGACLRRDAVRLIGEKRVRSAIADGTFATPWPGVVVDPARAAEPLTVVAAGLLAGGPEARASGPTAAFLHGLDAVDPTPVDLLVPYGSTRRTGRGLVVHNGRDLVDDTTEIHGLPALCLGRVLSDVLCSRRHQDALALVDQALARLPPEQREAFRATLHDRLRRRPDPRGTRVGARLLDLATGLAESPAESWMLWRIVDLGFPVPEVNHSMNDVQGRPRWRLDLSWPALRIAVEYDGRLAHLDRTELDGMRVQALRGLGWIVIVVDVDDLRSTLRVERELHEAFVARGLDPRGRTAGALRPRPHRERLVG
ncbi:hypothetical protein I4I81_25485 [Pseudonocardia abyssalis]|uniref:DUF559 domain-containing protein n=2 Tax=Pseudonocardia abyssalis TaxID=2792008 RepID=A0ABS6UZ99_9PSEU|nr:hypothetical protein [Pseudonocardia abyssalis]